MTAVDLNDIFASFNTIDKDLVPYSESDVIYLNLLLVVLYLPPYELFFCKYVNLDFFYIFVTSNKI